MDLLQAIIIAIVEGLTEYLPVSSTAHMIFTRELMGIAEDDFFKIFALCIQFGAILAVVTLYWRKFFDFSRWQFFVKLGFAVLPALLLGKLLDDYIDSVMGAPVYIAIMLIVGGVVLVFIDRFFKHPTILQEKDITIKKAVIIGFWQCLAMMPGTLHHRGYAAKTLERTRRRVFLFLSRTYHACGDCILALSQGIPRYRHHYQGLYPLG